MGAAALTGLGGASEVPRGLVRAGVLLEASEVPIMRGGRMRMGVVVRAPMFGAELGETS